MKQIHPTFYDVFLDEVRPVNQLDVDLWLRQNDAFGMLVTGLDALSSLCKGVVQGARPSYNVAEHIATGPISEDMTDEAMDAWIAEQDAEQEAAGKMPSKSSFDDFITEITNIGKEAEDLMKRGYPAELGDNEAEIDAFFKRYRLGKYRDE